MPGEEVILVVGDQAWANWASYEVSAQFETPADGWKVEARNPSSTQLAELSTTSVVLLLVGSTVLLQGRIDRKELRRTRSGTIVTLSGRDLAGQLVDCTPPASWAWRNVTLAALTEKALADLGITATVLAHTDAKSALKWAKAEVGETYWQVLQRYARKARLMLWMTPDGVLHLGRPDYTSDPVAKLVLGVSADLRQETNVEESLYVDDASGRYTEITVLGQARGTELLFGSGAHLKGVATDSDLVARGLVRPLVLDDGDLRSTSEAMQRASWEVSNRRFQGESLEYVVPGHGPARGVPWALNTMVSVRDELASINGVWWLAGYRIMRDAQRGSRSVLSLRPPNLLLPEVG